MRQGPDGGDAPSDERLRSAARMQLAALEEELASLRRNLQESCSPGHMLHQDHESLLHARTTVEGLLRLRRMRSELFAPDLFGEPAWDLLLELYLAELSHARLSMTGACSRSDAPPTTALRWLTRLIEAGWVTRCDDQLDARRSWVVLTPPALEAMRQLVSQAKAVFEPVPVSNRSIQLQA